MRIYETPFAAGLLTFVLLAAVMAFLDYLISHGTWALLGAALLPIALLVAAFHTLQGRRIEVDPQGREITISNAPRLRGPHGPDARPFSDVTDVRIERGAQVDRYILQFRDGTRHEVHAERQRRGKLRALLLK